MEDIYQNNAQGTNSKISLKICPKIFPVLEFSSVTSSKYAWKRVTLAVILEKSDSIIIKYTFIMQKHSM